MRVQYVTVSGLDKQATITYYNKLRDQLNSIVKYLKDSLNSLNEFKTDLSDYYLIDGSNVSNVDVTSIKNDIKDRINYIEGKVIPAIISKTNSIKKEPVVETPIVEEKEEPILPVGRIKKDLLGIRKLY